MQTVPPNSQVTSYCSTVLFKLYCIICILVLLASWDLLLFIYLFMFILFTALNDALEIRYFSTPRPRPLMWFSFSQWTEKKEKLTSKLWKLIIKRNQIESEEKEDWSGHLFDFYFISCTFVLNNYRNINDDIAKSQPSKSQERSTVRSTKIHKNVSIENSSIYICDYFIIMREPL